MTEDELGDTLGIEVDRPPLRTMDDSGNGARLAAHYGEVLMYCAAQGVWYVWDGRRWRLDKVEAVKLKAIEVSKWVQAEQPALEELILAQALAAMPEKARETASVVALRAQEAKEEAEKIIRKQVARTRHSAGVKATLELGRAHPPIAVTPDDMDGDPWLFNCLSGTIDLRRPHDGVRPHEPGDRITKISNVEHDPEATCPRWEAFMDWATCEDQDLAAYLQRLMGYALVGSVYEHVLPIFIGDGGNGKGVFFDILSQVMGDYAMPGAPAMLEDRGNERHPTDLADLAGSRLVVLSENERSVRLKEGLVKLLTGGDVIKARFMRKDFFSFRPSHTMILAVNHEPVITGTDNGIWRRVQIVPWNATVDDDERDGSLAEQIVREEAAGILQWLLRGVAAWREEGLQPAKRVAWETARLRGDMDVVGRFIEECCVIGPNARALGTDIYKKYREFCEAEGLKPWSNNAFSRDLAKRGFQVQRSGSKRYRVGISVAMPDGWSRWQDRV